ncbi:phospholipase [Arsenicitalea aurantiaca]|uniref:Phospholipase n=1 Tax=Arsenicitalea aurantiaca TaxID=1783274 RepID=A0A433X5S8_9HYPH|nr:prolyl oligopeptidase family serine peptidase [Arsenicitalea aurantiaca]RUT29401.1 phospholipase [Arsenicitalea aurantiaca]
MPQTLSGPMLPPASGGAPRQIVVLLHGYGADGNDLIALGQHWRALWPDALFVAPNAPEPCAESPMGYQWFPLALERSESRIEGVPRARPVVSGFLEALWAQTGLGAGETVLAGFSQGAMMALHTGLWLEETLAGIVGFSGALVPPRPYGSGPRPPVCLVHGDADQVVPVSLSQEAATALEAEGVPVSLRICEGVAHGISPEGLAFAQGFIETCLASRKSAH